MLRTDVINILVKKYGLISYLEIGTQYRENNFNHVKCSRKICVDPDSNAKADHIMTSDDFFEKNNETYDCIFIDGMHEHNQVYKDIENSLKILNEGGVIVCHDMLPTSEAMQKVPREAFQWTGDSWKAFVEMRANPNIEMFTVDTDFGCGVIVRGSQKIIEVPTEDLTYENFVKNKQEWMNIMSANDFFNLMK